MTSAVQEMDPQQRRRITTISDAAGDGGALQALPRLSSVGKMTEIVDLFRSRGVSMVYARPGVEATFQAREPGSLITVGMIKGPEGDPGDPKLLVKITEDPGEREMRDSGRRETPGLVDSHFLLNPGLNERADGSVQLIQPVSYIRPVYEEKVVPPVGKEVTIITLGGRGVIAVDFFDPDEALGPYATEPEIVRRESLMKLAQRAPARDQRVSHGSELKDPYRGIRGYIETLSS